MIILYHDTKTVVSVNCSTNDWLCGTKIIEAFFLVAEKNPDEIIAWCNIELKTVFNHNALIENLNHNHKLLSYSSQQKPFFLPEIGYIEDSPFMKINYNVTYPTWQMSGDLGGVFGNTLLAFSALKNNSDLDYFLCSLAKTGQIKGLLCYSVPALFKDNFKSGLLKSQKSSAAQLFRFIHSHYKNQWMLFSLMAFFIFQKKFKIISFAQGFFSESYSKNVFKLPTFKKYNKLENPINRELDVVIPTLFRKDYLLQVLRDLKDQPVLPKTVIIIEQNENPAAKSELNFIDSEMWPFKIIHRLIHKTGACKARNLALDLVESEWVFLADDDIRLPKDFIENAYRFIEKYDVEAVCFSCLQKGQIEMLGNPIQWKGFGSGTSIVNSKTIEDLRFDGRFEHGFGEDSDFGRQIRNKGVDIIYDPFQTILHLKASSGGFRRKHQFTWQDDSPQPKPSPTIMLYKLKHETAEQLLGYKLRLFINFYRHQDIKNPIQYLKIMRQRWEKSVNLAQQL